MADQRMRLDVGRLATEAFVRILQLRIDRPDGSMRVLHVLYSRLGERRSGMSLPGLSVFVFLSLFFSVCVCWCSVVCAGGAACPHLQIARCACMVGGGAVGPSRCQSGRHHVLQVVGGVS